MYVSKSMTFANPHIGHLRHGLFFTRLDCQSNAKPAEKDHDLPGIQTRDLWSSSQCGCVDVEQLRPIKVLNHLQKFVLDYLKFFL
jgi:hypothetical protein